MDENFDLDEMSGANMNTRDIHQHLKKRGWVLSRTSGGHDVYTHPKSQKNIAVPRHKQLKAPLVLGIMKTAKTVSEQEELNELKSTTLLSYRGKAVEKMDQKEKLAQRLKGIKRSGEKIKEKLPKKQVTEQHREEGRFKPVKPHNVKSVATVSPRATSDSADVKLREQTQLDELSKEKLGSYAKKASFDAVSRAMKYGVKNDQSGGEAKNLRKIHNREFGIRKAINRLTNEEIVSEGENKQMKGKDPCWKGYEMVGTKKKNGKDVPNCVPANEQMDNAPYAAPYAERKSGKDTVDSMSLAKQLAKTAAKKHTQRMGESVELVNESRKTQIVREAMNAAKEKENDKKKDKSNKKDKFEPDPELSSEITKTD